MIKVPKRLLEETKAVVRFYMFLRYDCGLKYADKLSTREMKVLLETVKIS